MAEWIYFIHPPREDFAATMTAAKQDAWARHWDRIRRLYAEGSVVLVGPTLVGCLEDADPGVVAADPAIAEGFARGELRPFGFRSCGGGIRARPARRTRSGR